MSFSYLPHAAKDNAAIVNGYKYGAGISDVSEMKTVGVANKYKMIRLLPSTSMISTC